MLVYGLICLFVARMGDIWINNSFNLERKKGGGVSVIPATPPAEYSLGRFAEFLFDELF